MPTRRTRDRWNQVDYPPLAFGRACDDYTIEPSSEKLEGLIKLASSYPTYPSVKDWYTQIQTLLDDYTKKHGSPPPTQQATTAAPATNSNVVVTEVQQGDATIITTHTNSASATPPGH